MKITDKEGLVTLANNADGDVSTTKSSMNSAKNSLNSISDYDGINISSAASTLSSNLDTVLSDLDVTVKNINTYATKLNELDISEDSDEISEEDYRALFATDGTSEGNAKAIWNFLKAKGLSDAAAAGVLGNIQAECNFRLTAVGDNGTSYGLIQWHNSRWNNLNTFCQQHGLDPSSLQGQLEFLWNESLDPNSGYGKNLAKYGFYTTSDPVNAAVIFHDVVEKSASSDETVRSRRGGYASNWYSKLNGTNPGIDISETNSFISTNASNAVAVTTGTTYTPATTAYSYTQPTYTPSSNSGHPSGSTKPSRTSKPNAEQSHTVNVELKPDDLTEEQYKMLFESDGTSEGNAKAIWNFLKAKGLSDEAAAAVLGNIQAECNFRLTAIGDNGTSFGLIQWHAGRWDRLKKYCEDNKLDPNSLQGQLEYLWSESLDPESGYGKNLAKHGFYDADNAVDAAVIFHDVVEKSASSPDTVRNRRGGFATTWFDKLKGTKLEFDEPVTV